MSLRLIQRHFGNRKFHYVLVIACATVILGAIAVYVLEAGDNANIDDFGDALWWAITTVTTVGYGDITPITPEGRLVAVALMLTGIGVIGVFTATVASLFFEDQQAKNPEMDEVLARLERIEQTLDSLRKQLTPAQRAAPICPRAGLPARAAGTRGRIPCRPCRRRRAGRSSPSRTRE